MENGLGCQKYFPFKKTKNGLVDLAEKCSRYIIFNII
jgi:hypothetical protein